MKIGSIQCYNPIRIQREKTAARPAVCVKSQYDSVSFGETSQAVSETPHTDQLKDIIYSKIVKNKKGRIRETVGKTPDNEIQTVSYHKYKGDDATPAVVTYVAEDGQKLRLVFDKKCNIRTQTAYDPKGKRLENILFAPGAAPERHSIYFNISNPKLAIRQLTKSGFPPSLFLYDNPVYIETFVKNKLHSRTKLFFKDNEVSYTRFLADIPDASLGDKAIRIDMPAKDVLKLEKMDLTLRIAYSRQNDQDYSKQYFNTFNNYFKLLGKHLKSEKNEN